MTVKGWSCTAISALASNSNPKPCKKSRCIGQVTLAYDISSNKKMSVKTEIAPIFEIVNKCEL